MSGPDIDEPTKRVYTARLQAAMILEMYQKMVGDIEAVTSLQDLITDLMHLADHKNIGWQDVIAKANIQFIQEKCDALKV